jgi:hypothetical protein
MNINDVLWWIKRWKVANMPKQVNYLQGWRAGRQKEGETKQICAPYLTAIIVYCEEWIEIQMKCAIYNWMRRKTRNKNHMH